MKKLLLVLGFAVLVAALRDVVGYFGPMAEAYRSYRDEARAATLAAGKGQRFRDVEGNIVDVRYHLETAEPTDDDEVRLVVLETIHFQNFSEIGALNRRVAQTRQYVSMKLMDGQWVVTHVEQDATELSDLSDMEFEDP